MAVQDTGKVWIRGTFSPVFAIRVADKFFVPGQEEGRVIEYWVDSNCLCVDLHDHGNKIRIARQFDLSLPAVVSASIFSGFERTQHADVQVITFRDKGVLEYIVSGDDYGNNGVGVMDRQTFWQRIKFPSI